MFLEFSSILRHVWRGLFDQYDVSWKGMLDSLVPLPVHIGKAFGTIQLKCTLCTSISLRVIDLSESSSL